MESSTHTSLDTKRDNSHLCCCPSSCIVASALSEFVGMMTSANYKFSGSAFLQKELQGVAGFVAFQECHRRGKFTAKAVLEASMAAQYFGDPDDDDSIGLTEQLILGTGVFSGLYNEEPISTTTTKTTNTTASHHALYHNGHYMFSILQYCMTITINNISHTTITNTFATTTTTITTVTHHAPWPPCTTATNHQDRHQYEDEDVVSFPTVFGVHFGVRELLKGPVSQFCICGYILR